MNNNIPLLSVALITYNQEKYISECIEGMLIQKTNFLFEIIISDDCSTDRTREICVTYQQAHPDLIKLTFPDKNLGMSGNWIHTLRSCTGKYIALCEGDDYWTDTHKLQKQVDFLEANPDYSMCFHNAIVKQENRDDRLFYNLKTGEYNGFDILRNWTIPTASVIFRNHIIEDYSFLQNTVYGDIFLFLVLNEKGKLFCINELFSVYRRLQQGVSMQNTIKQHKIIIKQYCLMNEFFKHKYSKIIRTAIFNSRMVILFIYYQNKNIIGFVKYSFCIMIKSPILLIQRFIRFFSKGLKKI